MVDIADIVCAFCGSIMGLSRETPASTETPALRFFTCGTCGASDLRIDRAGTGQGPSGPNPAIRTDCQTRPSSSRAAGLHHRVVRSG
jgi:hypothetical protein